MNLGMQGVVVRCKWCEEKHVTHFCTDSCPSASGWRGGPSAWRCSRWNESPASSSADSIAPFVSSPAPVPILGAPSALTTKEKAESSSAAASQDWGSWCTATAASQAPTALHVAAPDANVLREEENFLDLWRDGWMKTVLRFRACSAELIELFCRKF